MEPRTQQESVESEEGLVGEDSNASSEDLLAQVHEPKQKYLYLLSEFETYKRRMLFSAQVTLYLTHFGCSNTSEYTNVKTLFSM